MPPDNNADAQITHDLWTLMHLLDQCHLELGNAQIGKESELILKRYAIQIQKRYRGADSQEGQQ